MATLRYRLIGDPAFKFRLGLERFAGPEIDGIHKQVGVQLTTHARRTLEQSILRPWERGNRSGFRLTGRLSPAIQTRIIGRGETATGKGVGFPDIKELDRRARHWRRLEFGDETLGYTNRLPTGLFIRDGTPQSLRGRTAGDTFILYGEYARRARALGVGGTRSARGPLGPVGGRRIRFEPRRRTSAEGGRGNVRPGGPVQPIEGKYYLQEAWDFVTGGDGSKIIDQYEKKLREIFAEFRR